MFHMIRPGRFRHRLLCSSFLQSKAMQAAIEITQKASQLRVTHRLSDFEWTALYVFILSAHRRPHDFLGGPHNESFADNISGTLTCGDVAKLFSDTPRALAKLSTDGNFLSIFCERSLRSIPLSVQKSVVLWQKHNCLKLCEYVPSPIEVLEMQTHGMRCVSVLKDPKVMQNFVEEGRDVLGFVVHDLIHADHFFSNPAQAKDQIQFSKYLKVLNQLSVIQQKLDSDSEFVGEWNYLISDMNSVPLHLFKTLKAILLAAKKREHKIAFKTSLTGAPEFEFQNEIQEVALGFEFTTEQSLAWKRLNHPTFDFPTDAMTLQAAITTPNF